MIRFDKDQDRFNFRSVAIIKRDNFLLIHKNKGDAFWSLPGGRVEFFENSDQTVIRELEEELGWKAELLRPIWYLENFFTHGERNYHEISTYFLLNLLEQISIKEDAEFLGIEENVDLIFKWIDVGKLEEIEFEPKELKAKLKELPREMEFVKINRRG